MSTCRGCFSQRIAYVNGKTDDKCFFSSGNVQHNSYVPVGVGLCGEGKGGDYINFSYCLDCGKIQGPFPIPQAAVDGLRPPEEEPPKGDEDETLVSPTPGGWPPAPPPMPW